MLRPINRILAVDAGNSRIKWALHESAAFVSEGRFATDSPQLLDEQWTSLAAPDAVVIANVAGDTVEAFLRSGCKRWGLSPIMVKAVAQQCGVRSSYDNPEQLGADRWAALIGAHALVPGNCIVLNMGTATTIDALTGEGGFLGGLILPGLDMMHTLLSRKTARLGMERGEVVAFPHSTKDAMTTGAVRATCGAIEHMRAQMQQAGYDKVSVVATGGAAPTFVSHCGDALQLHERLVMQGLVRIGESAVQPSLS